MSSPGVAHVTQKFTFGKQKCREIAQQNVRLAGRLDEIKRRQKPAYPAPKVPAPKASSAINRKQRDTEIDRKNMLISRRLGEVKSVLGLGSRKSH